MAPRTGIDHDTDTTGKPRFANLSVLEYVFGGSRFLFWTLTPVVAIAAGGALLTIGDPLSADGAIRLLFATCLILFLLALASPRRFWWASRGVTGLVFVACLCFLIDQCIESQRAVPPPGRRGEDMLQNAIHSFVVFGLPSLWFTIRRRRPPEQGITRPAS
jgi:hypothetical protein